MEVRELITLQVGHYSNFIGTHWWNMQEAGFSYDNSTSTDINHDFLYREGRLSNRHVSYTPRLLVIEAKGSLGSLPVQGTLYNNFDAAPSTSHALWSDGVDLIHQIPEEKNEFLTALEEEEEVEKPEVKKLKKEIAPKKVFNLSSDVKVWSDFLRIHFHPNTIFILNEIEHEEQNLGGFQNGGKVMNREDIEEEITNRIRILAEGCGSLQGFNLLADVHNEMGGVAWKIAQYLSDEFDRKDIITFLSTPPHLKPEDGVARKVLLSSVVQSYSELYKVSSMVVPLNLRRHPWHSWVEGVRWNHITPNIDCPYESSAMLASFLDSSTMHIRTKSKPLPMNHLVQLLTPSLRKFVAGSLSMPLGMDDSAFFSQYLDDSNELLGLLPISCGCNINHGILSRAISLRGIPQKRNMHPSLRLPYNVNINNVKDMFEHHLNERSIQVDPQYTTCVKEPQSTLAPFPLIFEKNIDEKGFLISNRMINECGVSSVPVASGMYQTSGMKTVLETILKDGKTFDPTRIAKLKDEDLNWTETLEDFGSIVKNY